MDEDGQAVSAPDLDLSHGLAGPCGAVTSEDASERWAFGQRRTPFTSRVLVSRHLPSSLSYRSSHSRSAHQHLEVTNHMQFRFLSSCPRRHVIWPRKKFSRQTSSTSDSLFPRSRTCARLCQQVGSTVSSVMAGPPPFTLVVTQTAAAWHFGSRGVRYSMYLYVGR